MLSTDSVVLIDIFVVDVYVGFFVVSYVGLVVVLFVFDVLINDDVGPPPLKKRSKPIKVHLSPNCEVIRIESDFLGVLIVFKPVLNANGVVVGPAVVVFMHGYMLLDMVPFSAHLAVIQFPRPSKVS